MRELRREDTGSTRRPAPRHDTWPRQTWRGLAGRGQSRPGQLQRKSGVSRGIASQLWRWSWLFSLPLGLIFLLWAERVAERYGTLGLRLEVPGYEGKALERIGRMEMRHLLLEGKHLLRRPAASSLPEIQLFISERDLDRLNHRLPLSGRDFVDARLRSLDGKSQSVRVRYRGDHWWHWGYYKKSLRVRTERLGLFGGLHELNLIAPKFAAQLNAFLSYRLAERLDLLTPRHALANLQLNGRTQGLHLLLEQPGETLLRSRGRMPGVILSGDAIGERGYRHVSKDLFLHPGLWQPMGSRREEATAAQNLLGRLLDQLHFAEDTAGTLAQLLDPAVWGRYLAFEALAQSTHADDLHNWRLLADPALGRLDPIVWDPNGWHPNRDRHGDPAEALAVANSVLHRRLLQDHRYFAARQQSLEHFFAQDGDSWLLAELDRAIADVIPRLQSDPNLATQLRQLSARQVQGSMRQLREEVAEGLRLLRQRTVGEEIVIEHQALTPPLSGIDLVVRSQRPAAGLRLHLDRPASQPLQVTLSYQLNGRTVRVDVSERVRVEGQEIELDLPLLPELHLQRDGERGVRRQHLLHAPAAYKVLLYGDGLPTAVAKVQARSFDGRLYESRHELTRPGGSLWGADLGPRGWPLRAPVVWSGQVHVEGTEVLDQDLHIRAGTTVHFAPAASLLLRGQLLALGTPADPIRFRGTDSATVPWGGLALVGPKADGSRIRHVVFTGGSGFEYGEVSYTAMLSAHDVRDLEIEHTVLRDSQLYDDMMHLVYSEARMHQVAFEGAHGDALDLDFSRARLTGLSVLAPGNDGIDLMHSDARIVDTLIRGAGDKGISAGESSWAWVQQCSLLRNELAVASKDGATVKLEACELQDNRVALAAYRKNWRYPRGGRIELCSPAPTQQPSDIFLGEGSHILQGEELAEGACDEALAVLPELHRRIPTVRPVHDG